MLIDLGRSIYEPSVDNVCYLSPAPSCRISVTRITGSVISEVGWRKTVKFSGRRVPEARVRTGVARGSAPPARDAPSPGRTSEVELCSELLLCDRGARRHCFSGLSSERRKHQLSMRLIKPFCSLSKESFCHLRNCRTVKKLSELGSDGSRHFRVIPAR